MLVDPERAKRLREVVVGLLLGSTSEGVDGVVQELKEKLGQPFIANLGVPVPTLTPAPAWGSTLRNMVGVLRWDGSQTIAYVGINDTLTTAVVDTGACRTIMDLEMAKALGLNIRYASCGDCGTYAVPGTGATN